MKITKSHLKKIIKEEITKIVSVDDLYLAEMFSTRATGLEEKHREAGGQMMANQCVGSDGKPIQLEEELEEAHSIPPHAISDDELRRVHDLLNQGNIGAAKKLAAEDPDALSVIKQYEEELAAINAPPGGAPPTPEDELPEPY